MNKKALEAAYAAVENLPMRDSINPGGALDILRKREAVRAAIAAYEAETGWRTMDSAPKDGTEILAFAKRWEDAGCLVCAWNHETRGPGVSGHVDEPGWYARVAGGWVDDEGWDTGYGFIMNTSPTHWRPLPASPPEQEPRARSQDDTNTN